MNEEIRNHEINEDELESVSGGAARMLPSFNINIDQKIQKNNDVIGSTKKLINHVYPQEEL